MLRLRRDFCFSVSHSWHDTEVINYIYIVKVLLNHSGVGKNATNGSELAALQWYCRQGDVDALKVLLNDSRVNPSVEDNYGKSLNDMM